MVLHHTQIFFYFVFFRTYNYGLSTYKLGNDFVGLTIKSSQVLQNAEALGWPIHDKDTFPYLEAPGGYKFYIVDELQPTDTGIYNILLISILINS
jgi:hypothetical protein